MNLSWSANDLRLIQHLPAFHSLSIAPWKSPKERSFIKRRIKKSKEARGLARGSLIMTNTQHITNWNAPLTKVLISYFPSVVLPLSDCLFLVKLHLKHLFNPYKIIKSVPFIQRPPTPLRSYLFFILFTRNLDLFSLY